MAIKCYSMSLCCALFLCRTNPHIHEQGGDSAPTFYSSSKLRKSHFFTASPPLGGFGHFCPIAFLSTPAAHRSVQSWTHLPKIGEVCFLGQPNFGLSFSWRKKPPGLSKLNFQCWPKMCVVLRISTRVAYCTILCDRLFIRSAANSAQVWKRAMSSRFPKTRSETYFPF